jgi:isopropylmalate/homocitrate/citramalate synthase
MFLFLWFLLVLMVGSWWREGVWFVSPYNFVDDVRRGFELPERVLIHDTTLRDGEQQAGVVFRRDDKLRIAMALDEAGVDRIEAGMPAVSQEDFEAVREIARQGLRAMVMAFTRCLKSDVDYALKADVPGVVMELPASKHLIQNAYRWDLDKAIGRAVEAVEYAKEHGLYVTFFTIDATRSDMEFLRRVIEAVGGKMDSLTVADTLGTSLPWAYAYFIRQLRGFVNKPIEVHTHNDFGMGVANAIAGVTAGASVVHVTVNGIGERSGNAALEEVVMALELLLGVKTNVRLDRLVELSRLVQELSGVRVPPQKAVVGDNIFRIESGIVAEWWVNASRVDPSIAMPYIPKLVGRSDVEIILGKKSGKANITYWLDRLGIKASDEAVTKILDEVKRRSLEKRGPLSLEEFREIVSKYVV